MDEQREKKVEHVAEDILAKKISRKRFLQLTAGLGIAGAGLATFAGQCGGASPTATTAPAAEATTAPAAAATEMPTAAVAAPTATVAAVSTGARIPIRYVTWFWDEAGRQDAWRWGAKAFNDSQSDFELQEAGWAFTDFAPKIITMLGAGKLDAELLQCTPELGPRVLASGLLEPLDDIVSNLGITDLNPSIDWMRKDGKLYGLDVVSVGLGYLYNSQLFDKLGVKPPTTVDEWPAQAKGLTNRPNQFGMWSCNSAAEGDLFWAMSQEYALPYDGVWAKGKTPMVTSPEIVKGMQLFKTLYDDSFPQGVDISTAMKLMGTSNLAAMLHVSAAVANLSSVGPDVYDFLRSAVPPWPSKKSIVRVHPITVNAQSEKDKVAGAKAFLQFIYKAENWQQMMQKANDVIAPYPAAAPTDWLKTIKWTEGFLSCVRVAPGDLMGDFSIGMLEFGTILLNNFQKCLSANTPVADAMASAQTELEALGNRLFA
jgi:ABC-type glycerol-3-phosphate transport system substrate-binding protein